MLFTQKESEDIKYLGEGGTIAKLIRQLYNCQSLHEELESRALGGKRVGSCHVSLDSFNLEK